jgi:hypothetical protein
MTPMSATSTTTPAARPRRQVARAIGSAGGCTGGAGAADPPSFDVLTVATKRNPRPGTVRRYLYSPGFSPSTRRMALMHWLKLFSSTTVSGQTARIRSLRLISSPGFCTRYKSVSKARETSGRGRPSAFDESWRSSASSRNSPKS